jgi:regulatory protein
MKITAANRTKRGNIALSVDGEYVCSVQESAWLDSGLSVDDETDEETLNRLLTASQYASAKRKALNMLSARSYTEKQLTDRLARTHSRDTAADAVDRMVELGLVNDRDYALR